MPPPTTIQIIRHAEKPKIADEPVTGVDENAVLGDGFLTPRGWQRAGALVRFFAAPYNDAIETPVHVYAARVHPAADDESAARPYQTVLPACAKLFRDGKVTAAHPIQKFGKNDIDALAAEVLQLDGAVLICWEHHRIPRVVKALQCDERTPPAWPDGQLPGPNGQPAAGRFDLVWKLMLRLGNESDKNGNYRLSIIPQMLLDGDKLADMQLLGEVEAYNSAAP